MNKRGSFVHTAGANFRSAQDFVMDAASRHPSFDDMRSELLIMPLTPHRGQMKIVFSVDLYGTTQSIGPAAQTVDGTPKSQRGEQFTRRLVPNWLVRKVELEHHSNKSLVIR